MNALTRLTEEIFSADYAGQVIENICVNHLNAAYFWRRQYEVDIIIKDWTIPVEIKYRNNPTDIKGLIKFMGKFNSKYGVVITKDILELKHGDVDILFIPAWLFLTVYTL